MHTDPDQTKERERRALMDLLTDEEKAQFAGEIEAVFGAAPPAPTVPPVAIPAAPEPPWVPPVAKPPAHGGGGDDQATVVGHEDAGLGASQDQCEDTRVEVSREVQVGEDGGRTGRC